MKGYSTFLLSVVNWFWIPLAYYSTSLTVQMIELLFFTVFSGKQVRTKLAQAFNHWLNVPEDKLQVRNQPFEAFKRPESPDVYCCRWVQEGEMTLCSFRIGNLFCNANRVFSQLSCSLLNVNLKFEFRAQSIHDLLQQVVNAVEDEVKQCFQKQPFLYLFDQQVIQIQLSSLAASWIVGVARILFIHIGNAYTPYGRVCLE